MNTTCGRREFLAGSGAAILVAGIVGCAPLSSASREALKPRKRTVRLAHLTDIHVQPEREAERWAAQCLHHAQSLADPPDMILNGGDLIMDALAADRQRTQVQWDIAKRLLREECSLPILHCIGNHDIWGWNQERSGASPDDPGYGKQWAMEALEMERNYYARDFGPWRLIALDSNVPSTRHSYESGLDEEQFAWLESELAALAPTRPVIIFSHIPILCAAAYFDGDNEKSGDWIVPGRWMHQDARRIKDLFFRHPNVRLAISGHIHLLDWVEYNGVTYLCNGAVSGDWWKGNYQETPPGYAVVDLYDDGSFAREYIAYDWREG